MSTTIREALAGKEPFEIRPEGVFVVVPNVDSRLYVMNGRSVMIRNKTIYVDDAVVNRAYPATSFRVLYGNPGPILSEELIILPDHLDHQLPEDTNRIIVTYENGSFGFRFESEKTKSA